MFSLLSGDSFITAALEDFGLNIFYKCHKAEEYIEIKLYKPKQNFMEGKKGRMISCFPQEWLFHRQKPFSICFYFLSVWYAHHKAITIIVARQIQPKEHTG